MPNRESNREDNRAQAQSDAPVDEVRQDSERAKGQGSDANGVPEFDEADGEKRKELYKNGAKLVSRID
jgi:hypothetical protein